jgi:hypothetical protein
MFSEAVALAALNLVQRSVELLLYGSLVAPELGEVVRAVGILGKGSPERRPPRFA